MKQYEIYPVRDIGTNGVEKCAEDYPMIFAWGVYQVEPSGERIWISDHKTKADAEKALAGMDDSIQKDSVAEHTTHTPGPWSIMADPDKAGLHPLHDYRYIVSGSTEIQHGYDTRDGQWSMVDGRIVCQLMDQESQPQDARLIAAAPEMLSALLSAYEVLSYSCNHEAKESARKSVINALNKALGATRKP